MIEWLDAGTIELFQPLHNPVLTVIMKFFTTIGEGGAVWILAAVLLLLFKKTRKAGIILAGALVLCLLSCNVALKNLVARPRPCWRREDLEMLIAIPKDFSFPSGHTTASFAGAACIFSWDRRWGIVAYVTAVLIAVSRLYFFVHYATDVLAGMVLGTCMAWISIKVVNKIMSNRTMKG